MNSRLEEAKESISDLEENLMEREKKELCNMRLDLGNSVKLSNVIFIL